MTIKKVASGKANCIFSVLKKKSGRRRNVVWPIKGTFDQKTHSGFVATSLNTKDFCCSEVWKAEKKESSLRKLSVFVKYLAGTSTECSSCIWYPTGSYRFFLILIEREIGDFPPRSMCRRLAWLPRKHVEPQRMSPHISLSFIVVQLQLLNLRVNRNGIAKWSHYVRWVETAYDVWQWGCGRC